ncbi:1-acyl-sn-glycerol-3-phosphate acyltransferase [Candidatus Saccharibacteria bacterium]|nr:1-acyl-sn-glycerol-3-phosphate acyltransferase [Candidatus Saccharibacteria bacterium]
MSKRTLYFSSFDQDFAESRNQDFVLPNDYDWIGGFGRKVGGFLLYPLVMLIDFIYMKFVVHISIKNKRVLRKIKGGYFLYANHTLVFGDVVDSFLITWPTRPYLICSAANLGIALIGGWLPAAGALPLPDDLSGMKKLAAAVSYRIKQGRAVVVYPESHMWPYYTKIRPFTEGSFHYAVANQAPVFSATTTFMKSRIFKRPKINIYIDGPFVSDKDSRKEQQKDLSQKVRAAMEERAKLSNIEYITYRKKA